jgi:uncharacterized coiled-coil protein SlyX
MPAFLRRIGRHFSISAPRMAVRTHLGWPWKAALAAGLVLLVGGMWWLGFDFGQILGGFNRKEIEQRIATLEADAATAQREATALRARNSELESEIAMALGVQETLKKQVAESAQENAQLKEELAFLQGFFADSSKPGIAIPRIAADANSGERVRYTALIVRGGAAKADFEGHATLSADLVPGDGAPAGSRAITVALPDDDPEAAGALRLRFKYYQRIEGSFRIPPGYVVRAITVRAYESGTAGVRATRTLTLA